MISSLAVVQSSHIGSNVTIGEFAIIREGAIIGNDVIIHPNVVITSGVIIGDGTEVFPGAFIGKEPKGAGALSRLPDFQPKVFIGANCSIGPHAIIYYDVMIGNTTLIGDGASVREQSTIGSKTVIGRYVTINYNVHIGDSVKIMDHSWMAGNMTVENHVFISGGVLTSNDNLIGKSGYSNEHVVGPTIKHHASIGLGAKILPHLIIGEHSIVGAGAVVTKDVPAHVLVMGVPATVAKAV